MCTQLRRGIFVAVGNLLILGLLAACHPTTREEDWVLLEEEPAPPPVPAVSPGPSAPPPAPVSPVKPVTPTSTAAIPPSAPSTSTPSAEPLTLRDRAVAQIFASIESSDGFIRANAIEAAQYAPEHVLTLVRRGLGDRSEAVRFAALMVIGKLRLADVAPAARNLVHDPSASVRAAALFALKRTGQRVDLSPLAGMLVSQEPKVRANAAMILGLLEDPSAIPMLKDLARYPLHKASAVQEALVRLQFTEAILRLGDHSVLDAMRAYACYSQFDEVRVLGISMVGELGDRALEPAIEQLLNNSPLEVQIAAAGTLARLGREHGLAVVLRGSESASAPVRAQAAMTLAHFRDPQALARLTALLDDPSEQVRIAAAAAILRRPG